MTKTLFITLLISLFTLNITFGQLKYEAEQVQITLLNGQTKEGYSKKVADNELSKGINFGLSETDKDFVYYDISNLKSFSINGSSKYEVQLINVNNNTTPIKVFSQLLIKGKASLYKSYYNSDIIYIIVNNDTNYVLQQDELKNNATAITKYNYLSYLSIATDGASNNNLTADFNENTFVRIVSEYNKMINSDNEIYTQKTEKPVSFQLVFGGYGEGVGRNVLYLQGLNRVYYPSISRTTSLNFGLNYYYENYGILFDNQKYDIALQVASIPLIIQQNFSTKSFRPYIFAGIGLTYKKETSELFSKINYSSKAKFGPTLSYGAGVEVDIVKGLMVKAEYKQDLYSYILIGIGYNFSKK